MNRPGECILCLVSNRLRDLLQFKASESKMKAVLSDITGLLELDRTRAFVESFESVKKALGTVDPYSKRKSGLDQTARATVALLRPLLEKAEPRHLLWLAASANALDTYVLGYEFEETDMTAKLLLERPTIDDSLEIDWNSIRTIAYVLDNRGEVVFDVLVIERLVTQGYRLHVIARGMPYEIDVTAQEVQELVGKLPVKVISTGTAYPALYRKKVSSRVWNAIEASDLVVVKGIANFEAFLDTPVEACGKLFFLFRAKCPVLSEMLGVPQGSSVIVSERRVLREVIRVDMGKASLHAICKQ